MLSYTELAYSIKNKLLTNCSEVFSSRSRGGDSPLTPIETSKKRWLQSWAASFASYRAYWRIQGGAASTPNGTQLFHFHIHIRQKAPASEVAPPPGNPIRGALGQFLDPQLVFIDKHNQLRLALLCLHSL